MHALIGQLVIIIIILCIIVHGHYIYYLNYFPLLPIMNFTVFCRFLAKFPENPGGNAIEICLDEVSKDLSKLQN